MFFFCLCQVNNEIVPAAAVKEASERVKLAAVKRLQQASPTAVQSVHCSSHRRVTIHRKPSTRSMSASLRQRGTVAQQRR